MTTYLLTWNPAKWNWADLEQVSGQTAAGNPFRALWSCGNTRSIQRGDRVFLLKQGQEPRGLMASGWVLSDEVASLPHHDEERARQGQTAFRVEVEFERILNPAADALLRTDGFMSDALNAVN